MSIVQAVIDDLSATLLAEGDVKRVIADLHKKATIPQIKQAACDGDRALAGASIYAVYDNALSLAVSMRAEFELRIERYKRGVANDVMRAGWQASDLAARQAYDEALKLCVTVRNIIEHRNRASEPSL